MRMTGVSDTTLHLAGERVDLFEDVGQRASMRFFLWKSSLS